MRSIVAPDRRGTFGPSGRPAVPSGDRRGQGRSGFTLVELLVVITIVSLLIALLLPVLETARNQATKVVCASRQRQVLQAFHTYANDYDAYLPYLENPNGGHANRLRFGRMRWENRCHFYSWKYDKTDLAESYLPPSNAYFCPFKDISSYQEVWGSTLYACNASWWAWNAYIGKSKGAENVHPEINGRRLGEHPEWPLVSDHIVNKTIFQANPPYFTGPHMKGRWEDTNNNHYQDATGVPDHKLKVSLNFGYPDGSVQAIGTFDKLSLAAVNGGRNATFWHVRD